MNQKSVLTSALYLLWSAALIALLFWASHLEKQAIDKFQSVGEYQAFFWSERAIYFGIGVLISLLFLKRGGVRVNGHLLLFAFVPLSLASLLTPINTLTPNALVIPISSLVCGLLLVPLAQKNGST
ncbi:hypothetical protein ACFFSY_14385 [Paenibacillus aurantiacus]|uniref:Uncharacterized protein n=1 Tax=Paenibacillus aurantiacus TaxID=1936118 RepID=A0ABV5KSM6_9BACL